ncbi:hypothetical protein A2U01_0025415 [Trifolium medium]|uniref:Uncharacterized protein n=1 Tax=Trifolium medium TaxID=97028 RepID=A0A392NX29_9FABA|nr:hypothetical protein [Trifolium medium]
MRGRVARKLIFDSEIEKTTKANQKAARLSWLAERELTEASNQFSSGEESQFEDVMAEDPPRLIMGDYCRRTNAGQISMGFQSANHVAFDIKNTVLSSLREN